MWVLSLQHTGLVVVVCGFSCPEGCGILVPWPGIEPRSPALQVDSLSSSGNLFDYIYSQSCWQTNVILFTIIYPSGACINKYLKVKVTQLCSTLCDPMDYTVHGIFQVRILEWVVVPFSRGFSQPRNRTQVSQIEGGFFTSWATKEA